MKIVAVKQDNIEKEHICCALGRDATNQKRAESKKVWMQKQFDNGLIFNKFDGRGKFFIEFMPIEKAWKPVIGKNYYMIHCLWVAGRFKGQGLATQLLEKCIKEAKNQGKDGIAVVSSRQKKPFLTDAKFFKNKGFELVDQAPPYFELLAFSFHENNEKPMFAPHTQKDWKNRKGFTFVYSNQCPFMEEYVERLGLLLKTYNIPFSIEKITSAQEAKEKGSPFGTYGLYFDGKFQTHELMSEKKFTKYLKQMGII